MNEATQPSPEALALLDGAACGLLQTDDEGLILRVNRTFCRWLGYTPAQLVGIRKLQELLTMGGRLFHHTHWMPLMKIQGSVSEIKFDVVRLDGRKVPMMMNALRHTVGGTVVHDVAAFIARDQDRYEKELLLAQRRLEDMVDEARRLQAEADERALLAEQMAALVGGDLRAPLSTIRMGVELLKRGESGAVRDAAVEKISRAAVRADRLVADLQDLAAARLGDGLALAVVPLALHEVVGECVEALAAQYPGHALRHESTGTGSCVGDPPRLAQLTGNLVANAMAYGAADRPVTVTTAISRDAYSIAVHNDGPPIAAELQHHIFNPRVQAAGGAGGGRSVGLGLFIVHEIARAHGGAATIASAHGIGTTFRVSIPRTP